MQLEGQVGLTRANGAHFRAWARREGAVVDVVLEVGTRSIDADFFR